MTYIMILNNWICIDRSMIMIAKYSFSETISSHVRGLAYLLSSNWEAFEVYHHNNWDKIRHKNTKPRFCLFEYMLLIKVSNIFIGYDIFYSFVGNLSPTKVTK